MGVIEAFQVLQPSRFDITIVAIQTSSILSSLRAISVPVCDNILKVRNNNKLNNYWLDDGYVCVEFAPVIFPEWGKSPDKSGKGAHEAVAVAGPLYWPH